MYGLGPGQAAHVYDYSDDPRLLLGLLADTIREQRHEGAPLVHVRRGWLHGTHLVVTVRPLARVPLSLDGFAATAGSVASQLAAAPPSERDYLARAEELARWDGTAGPYLPLRPQGFTTVAPALLPERWSQELLDARDQLAGRLTEPLLAAATLPADVLLPHAARVVALCARAHPYGIGIGTLPLRSHTEGIWSATGGTVDLRAAFTERYERDRELFTAAHSALDLADPTDPETAVLHSWNEALHACWGTATALAASGSVDERRLDVAPRLRPPLEGGVPSPFHGAARQSGLNDRQPYWHIANRLLLNVLYTALSSLGITPVQRYYLCFGVSSAADELLGEDWSQRMERIAGLQGGPTPVPA
ncbi:hypothetical protein K7472_02320 [Streptomyces sp. PTM05]|uniref:Thiopeptide-type bacteriocin biosynthesis domain-containing protein n=1 Tax=Streptantibioticus parmotrematis TaxID=2873249 RepID=A0ABS7QLN3_9ACTN|nr:hypothetical protein [Streptantibioticus parmotrematis]MBY8883681.1 hypothetical protein [Streptantibioticus parmotrematis]